MDIFAVLLTKHAIIRVPDTKNPVVYRQITSDVRRFYGLPVKKGAAVSPRGEKLFHKGIINYTDFGFLIYH